jgi:uncharacterized glyoxalase superfamily protein PhnB
MRNNRSVPPCPVIPVLRYPDPAVAAQWLGKAFGFTVRLRIANHRIQMRAGEGCFTIAEGDIPPNHSVGVQVRIVDAFSHCERAQQAGAKILTPPTDHMYGDPSIQCRGLLRPSMGLHRDDGGRRSRELGRHPRQSLSQSTAPKRACPNSVYPRFRVATRWLESGKPT